MPTDRTHTEPCKGKFAKLKNAGALFLKPLIEMQERERQHLRHEITQVKGLMPLLMKQRNQGRWSRTERLELLSQLRSLSALSPYFMLLVLPGAFLTLPLFAWWMDRRRKKRTKESQDGETAKRMEGVASDANGQDA